MARFTDSHSLPVSAAQLLACYTDPAFITRKYAALGRQEVEIHRVEQDGDSCEFEVSYLEHTEHEALPAFARKFLSSHTRIRQTARWNLDSARGSLSLRPEGPASMDCQMCVEDADDGCLLTLDWAIKVRVPMLGGKLEEVLKQGMQLKSRNDETVSRELLAAACG